MLTEQNIIANRKKLVNYEQCKYRCKSKQDFCEGISPDKVVEFAALCALLELELCERRVDYYTPEQVGRLSPYFQGCQSSDSDSFVLSDSEREAYYRLAWDSDSVVDFNSCVCPVQLELPL